MNYQWTEASLTETTRIRAFAILLIITHNFLHHVMDTPGENEFGFSIKNFHSFKSSLWNTPLDSVRILSTYLGHYGVQVFFFLSGYGVAIKYRSLPPNTNPTWWQFVKKRLLALYPAIIIAAIGFIVYQGFRTNFTIVLLQDVPNLIKQIAGIACFIPNSVYSPIGPWWFIGAIVQFYLIAPFILKQKRWPQKTTLITIILASIIAEITLGSFFYHKLSVNINHTIFGQLDVCVFGMLLAQYKKITFTSTKAIIFFASAIALFILGNYHSTIWILTSITATIILIPSIRYLITHLKKITPIDRFIIFTGNLSLYLFLCNGYLRKPLIEYAQEDPIWWKSIILLFPLLLLVYTWSIIIRFITKKSLSLLTNTKV